MGKKRHSVKEELLNMLNGYFHPKLVELVNGLGLDETKLSVKLDGNSGTKTFKVNKNGNSEYYENHGWKKKGPNKARLFENRKSKDLLKIAEAYGVEIIKLKKEEDRIWAGIEKLKKSGCYIELYERNLITEKIGV